MSITVKFIILYLIPILTFAGSFGVYRHAYGKSPEDTYINIAFFFVVLGFIASCAIAFALINQFVSIERNYLGIVFSLLPWGADLLVLGLYLVVFYGFFNP